MSWSILECDCVQAMAAMDEASVDAVVCDPPYGIRFMGKAWDGAEIEEQARRSREMASMVPDRNRPKGGSFPQQSAGYKAGAYDFGVTANHAFQDWCHKWAAEALRVLKPGGHLIAFGGTRTYHRLVAGIEDAGFEIRDQLAWMFGSGFPKSLDVSKAITATQTQGGSAMRDLRRARLGENYAPTGQDDPNGQSFGAKKLGWTPDGDRTPTALTPEAEQWDGWGTALKPAHEPIVLARKPLAGTVAANVLAHGTGALNVDGCRIAAQGRPLIESASEASLNAYGDGLNGSRAAGTTDTGRWPANVVLDPDAAAMLDEQTGTLTSGAWRGVVNAARPEQASKGAETERPREDRDADAGGASRFFYCAKTSSAERGAGLDGGDQGAFRNTHPTQTVKPIDLMRWLVRLVTPPGGTVLDPFTGSGTTGCAALLEGFDFVGIEREPEYAAIARARIAWWADHPDGMSLVHRLEHEAEAKAKAISGQLDIFGEVA